MNVRELGCVEALTPTEAAVRAEVPVAWLLRLLDHDEIPHSHSSWMPLVASTQVERIAQLYAERQERLERQREYNRRYQRNR